MKIIGETCNIEIALASYKFQINNFGSKFYHIINSYHSKKVVCNCKSNLLEYNGVELIAGQNMRVERSYYVNFLVF